MKNNFSRSQLLTTLFIAVYVLIFQAGCTKYLFPNRELTQDMMDQPTLKAQKYDEDSPNHRGMRNPPDNTIPVGFKPYAYPLDPVAAEKNLVNPFAGDFSEERLTMGQKYFETNCSVCHGLTARGEGLVAVRMPLKPPSLMSQKVRDFKDGRIYHIIRMGQGIMQPYGSQVVREEWKWSIVNYVRYLQKNQSIQDLPLAAADPLLPNPPPEAAAK